MSERFTITFEGRPVAAQPGQSVAAALIAAGLREWRETRDGPDRGLFCGMGVCQDCLVGVNGLPNRRACMTKAEPGLAVTRQAWPGETAETPRSSAPLTAEALRTETPDLLVIGAGAGGLCAALAARRCGLDVTLLDERAAPGGQYYKQPAPGLGAPLLDGQQAEGAALVAEARGAGVSVIAGCEVWGAFASDAIVVFDGAQTRRFAAKSLVVATGAYERGLPLPGWTLPGVMTTGAAQTLWRSYRTLPGRRVLVAGNGPLNLQVALELAAGGAEVVAVAEAAPMLDPAAAVRLAFASPRLALQGGGYLAGLRRRGIPLHRGSVLLQVEQVKGGLSATIGRPGRPLATYSVDAVAMGYGFLPANDVLRALGCRHHYDERRRHLVTARSETLETSVPGVFAVGDCAGLGGALAAREEGLIAGLAAVRGLGHVIPPDLEREEGRARQRLQRHRRFQDALWSLYAATPWGLSLAAPDTLVCRCEEVTRSSIDEALADGRPSLGEVKRRTRCGMGRCQGRYCAAALAEHLAETQGRALDERAFFAPRAPIKPMAIADLVALGPET